MSPLFYASSAEEVDGSSSIRYRRALPASRSLPENACSFAETDTSGRPTVLASHTYPARTCNSSWKSNMYVLVMGRGYEKNKCRYPVLFFLR